MTRYCHGTKSTITRSKLTIETRARCKICLKLTIKTPERRQWRRKCRLESGNPQKQSPEVFYKKAVPKTFSIFTRKYLCWSLILIAGLKACNLIKKRLQHMCFPVDISKFLEKYILRNICKRLLLNP